MKVKIKFAKSCFVGEQRSAGDEAIFDLQEMVVLSDCNSEQIVNTSWIESATTIIDEKPKQTQVFNSAIQHQVKTVKEFFGQDIASINFK